MFLSNFQYSPGVADNEGDDRALVDGEDGDDGAVADEDNGTVADDGLIRESLPTRVIYVMRFER